MLLNLTFGEEDDDGQAGGDPRFITDEQIADINALIRETKSDGVKVLRIADGQVVYSAASGENRKPLEQVVRMQVDDEPALNAAEQALFAEKWDEAVDAYTKAARATNKPWLKDWATIRLLAASQKSNRLLMM